MIGYRMTTANSLQILGVTKMGKLKIRKPKKKTLNQHAEELARLQINKQALTDKIFSETEKRIEDVTSVFYMAYFCLALHRKFGFGRTRLERALQALDELDTELCGMSIDEMRNLALKECGVWLGTEAEAKKLGLQ